MTHANYQLTMKTALMKYCTWPLQLLPPSFIIHSIHQTFIATILHNNKFCLHWKQLKVNTRIMDWPVNRNLKFNANLGSIEISTNLVIVAQCSSLSICHFHPASRLQAYFQNSNCLLLLLLLLTGKYLGWRSNIFFFVLLLSSVLFPVYYYLPSFLSLCFKVVAMSIHFLLALHIAQFFHMI